MNKKNKRKLQLNQNEIRKLDSASMQDLVGGKADTADKCENHTWYFCTLVDCEA